MKRNLELRNDRRGSIALFCCGVVILLFGSSTTVSAITIQQDNSEVANATPDERIAEIEGWIEQLTESSLTKRRKAKEALIQADSAAIPLLAKAALSDKRELIVYSLEVLGILQEKSPNDETRKAARVTLQMLADSQQPSTAERAKQMLGSAKDEGIEAFPGWDDPNSGFAGGGGGAGRSVSVSSINGMKTIRIEEAGRVTTFRDEARGAIRVTIQDGDKKEEFVAKDMEALQKKDPEAHALYEQHGNGVGGGINIEAFAGGFPNFGNNMNIQNMQNAQSGQNATARSGRNVRGGQAARNMGRNASGNMGENAGGIAMGNGMANGPGGAVFGNQDGQAGMDDAAGVQAGTEMMIQQLEELKRRLADHPEMTQMLDAQIRQLKQK